jgi:hypothetical protein
MKVKGLIDEKISVGRRIDEESLPYSSRLDQPFWGLF